MMELIHMIYIFGGAAVVGFYSAMFYYSILGNLNFFNKGVEERNFFVNLFIVYPSGILGWVIGFMMGSLWMVYINEWPLMLFK